MADEKQKDSLQNAEVSPEGVVASSLETQTTDANAAASVDSGVSIEKRTSCEATQVQPSSSAGDVLSSSPNPCEQTIIGKPNVVVRLPNITMPCNEGLLIDVRQYLPAEADISSVSVDYVFGRFALDDDKVRIFPTEPGEQDIGLVYRQEGKRCETILKLLVNQDPKKLWVKNDPPSGSPFMKKLYDASLFSNGSVRFLAASRRGRSHELAGTFRDDDFGFWTSPNGDVSLIVVADGAGSAKYSREGSRQAVQAVVSYLSTKLLGDVWELPEVDETKDGKVAQLLVSAANNALVLLDAFCKTENAKPNASEKYALKDFNTTLLMAAVRILPDGGRKIVTFSIGDGAIAWVEPEQSQLLCAPDGGEYSGQTRFLTTTPVWSKAATDWGAFRAERVFVKTVCAKSAGQGFLALMTDGVSDPFFETDSKLNNPAEWNSFVLSDADVDEGARSLKEVLLNDADDAAEGLLLWLGFWSRGNHDDRTLAVLLPCELTGVFGRACPIDEQSVNDKPKHKAMGIWDQCRQMFR